MSAPFLLALFTYGTAILHKHRIPMDPNISFVHCIIICHKLSGLKQHTFITNTFCRTGIWALLNWIFCLRVHKAVFKVGWAAFSLGGLEREGSAFKLPHVVGRIHFLMAVEFMAACFFKVLKQ